MKSPPVAFAVACSDRTKRAVPAPQSNSLALQNQDHSPASSGDQDSIPPPLLLNTNSLSRATPHPPALGYGSPTVHSASARAHAPLLNCPLRLPQDCGASPCRK